MDPHAQATRVQLDDDYMLLLWRHDDQPKRICDVFWMKKSHVRCGVYSRQCDGACACIQT